MTRRASLLAAILLMATAGVSGCGSGEAGGTGKTVQVTVGYQSKTINTVNAGTLLRSLGYFEKRLEEIGRKTGTTYKVTWQDYATGAPITAQMLAEKIDIGSMGDYPVLINGSKTREFPNSRTEFIAVTGYNLRGGLNGVVVAPGSTARALKDLKGKKISVSLGSAGHGMVVRALRDIGLEPADVRIENQDPAVGSSALRAGSIDALSQFVAWPGLLVFQDQARLLFDGSTVGVPTLHGVVARKAFTQQHPEATDAFLGALNDATRYLHEKPLDAAETVASAAGLPAEVVYLYNGPNGISTFDTTIKPPLRQALQDDIPFLTSIGVLQKSLQLNEFVNDQYLKKVYGPSYDADVAKTDNPSRISGTDQTCNRQVEDPKTASEAWLAGEDATHPAATPTCLLRFVRSAQNGGKKLRAAYVPDAATGTRWFADKAVWVEDRSGAAESRFLPFAAPGAADAYVAAHPGQVRIIDYRTALDSA